MSYRPSGGFLRDTSNSTTSPLTASSVFTGTATDVTAYNQIHVAMKMGPNVVPDGDGSTAQGSLSVQFSPDGTNWDIQIPVYVRSGIFIPQTYVVVEQFFRLVYTNDGGASAITALGLSETPGTPTDQTFLRLNSYLLYTGTKELGRTIDQPVSGSDPVIMVRSLVTGQSSDGSYSNVRVNDRGVILVGDFLRSVSRGDVPGYSTVSVTGRNPDIDTASTPEDIWGSSGLYTGQPVHSASAETISIVSSDANDASGGTGARTMTLEGLDSNFDSQIETVTMDGLTPVTTSGAWKRMTRANVVTAGTTGSNEGTITINHTTTTSNVFAIIEAGLNSSTACVSTIPNAKTGHIIGIRMQISRSSGAAGSADVSLMVRGDGGVYKAIRYETITTGLPVVETIQGSIELAEKTDILMRVENVSDNNTIASAAIEYFLVDD